VGSPWSSWPIGSSPGQNNISQRFVDDHHSLRLIVEAAEGPPTYDRNAHRLEVSRTDDGVFRLEVDVVTPDWADRGSAVTTRNGELVREGGRTYTRQLFGLRDQCLQERPPALLVVATRRLQVHEAGNQATGFESWLSQPGVEDASSEQRCTRHETE